jgi:hypothetical protein
MPTQNIPTLALLVSFALFFILHLLDPALLTQRLLAPFLLASTILLALRTY